MIRAPYAHLIALASLMLVAGCCTHDDLTRSEVADVRAGDAVVVLLRVECTIDGEPTEAFIGPSLERWELFAFALESFETVGDPVAISPRFISPESRRAGWTYYILPPGLYYLSVIGPDSRPSGQKLRSLSNSPRWCLDVPEGVEAVYVGTILFAGKSHREPIFGVQVIESANSTTIPLRDECEEARDVLARFLREAFTLRCMLLQRWHPGEPTIIRTPPAKRRGYPK